MKRNYNINAVLRIMLFVAGISCSSVLWAQQDDSVSYAIDSTASIETPEEVETTDTATEAKNYFENKSNTDLQDVKLRRLPLARRKSLQDGSAFWYANYSFTRRDEAESERKSGSITRHPAFQTILWIVIIGGFAAFVILYLVNSNAGIFRKSRSIGEMEDDENATDIFAINYQREIDKAVGQGNYRLAIRMMFLRLLKSLAEKNIIEYKQDRTNFDYLLQLQKTGYYAEFFKLTRHYEYSWYGQFNIEKDNFFLIRKEFESLDRKLN